MKAVYNSQSQQTETRVSSCYQKEVVAENFFRVTEAKISMKDMSISVSKTSGSASRKCDDALKFMLIGIFYMYYNLSYNTMFSIHIISYTS